MTKPFEPIPDSTQVHVDRLVGARVGEYTILTRAAEGRFGTLYRGQHTASSKPVTVEVLRSELVGNDEEARAANAIKCAAIADVVAFGQVADGRRFRVMEQLEGESLDAELQRKGKFSERETLEVLAEVAGVLQASHAWAITHGGLDATNVLRVGGKLKVIDFGLARHGQPTEVDLQALGALGFALLTGRELDGGVPPPLGSGVPELTDRLLRELLEKRIPDATTAQRELKGLMGAQLAPLAQFPNAPKKKSRAKLVAVAVGAFVIAVGAGGWYLMNEEVGAAIDGEGEALSDEELAAEPEQEEPELVQLQQPEQVELPTAPKPAATAGPKKSTKPPPSARVLMATISKLESRLRSQKVKPGDDLEQALFVLNKQRLRLTGNPSELDRRDVAKQLAGWKRSYLR